ncbi:HAD-IA family hydrolase [Paraburkholderia sp. CNPSo 3272]|uniref:HAD-IA family hydrolase n=1 Tax=Paraburkholderia sp. CNPSo 3272 TaxID=2940931 RepID=UPI0020B874AB|nr:HAD-IA family hydrolase [Paraburkholderia sp. CNPSo 3272]MCP3727104.1 HAD-IA family hydrolase [Paraburkholderia sp. CNPSo 3272]
MSVFERHRETEATLGLPPGTLAWLGPIDPSTDMLWQSMQRDEITERDYWAMRAREMGASIGERDWDVRAMLTRTRQTDPNAVVRPAMVKLIRRARANGILIGILSNELELFYGAEFLSQMSVLKDMAAIVDATHTEILKPDRRAYQLAMDALNMKGEDILFVDDQMRNIVGAVKAGLQVQFFDLRDINGNIAAIATRLNLSVEELT